MTPLHWLTGLGLFMFAAITESLRNDLKRNIKRRR